MTETGADFWLRHSPDELAGHIRHAQGEYLKHSAKLREYREIAPKEAVLLEQTQEHIDELADQIRQGEAILAARATARGGAPLTAEQAGHLLRAIGAGDNVIGLHLANPEEWAARLTRVLTVMEGPFEARLRVIEELLRKDRSAGPA